MLLLHNWLQPLCIYIGLGLTVGWEIQVVGALVKTGDVGKKPLIASPHAENIVADVVQLTDRLRRGRNDSCGADPSRGENSFPRGHNPGIMSRGVVRVLVGWGGLGSWWGGHGLLGCGHHVFLVKWTSVMADSQVLRAATSAMCSLLAWFSGLFLFVCLSQQDQVPS